MRWNRIRLHKWLQPSEAGEATISALKSARDQLSRPGEVNLMLVMSGSDRDKLLRLVNTSLANVEAYIGARHFPGDATFRVAAARPGPAGSH